MSEKEVTREITEPEELQAEEEKCATAADSQLNIAPAEQSSKSFEIPAEIFQKQQENEADLKKWKKRIRKRLTGLTALLRRNEAENENSMVEISILEKNEKTLNQKKMTLTAQLARLQRFIEKKQKEIRNLNQERYELDCRVDDAKHTKEAELALLTAEINTVQRTLHTLQERKTFLLDQNSHTAAVLTQVESHRDKLSRRTLQVKETVQNLKNEIQEAEYQIMMTEDEKKLNRIIADKQNQTDDLIKGREIRRQIIQALKDQPSLLQKKKILADSEETMNPAAEPPPNSGSWFPSTKGLLVGLGLAVGGLLIYSAFPL